jgi:hypothetical protein
MLRHFAYRRRYRRLTTDEQLLDPEGSKSKSFAKVFQTETDTDTDETPEARKARMKEEDQIMYVLYLEKIFGTEIQFAFSTAQPMVALKDGANLMGLTLTVNYQTSYDGFLDMINYLATDSRVTSVQFAQIQYDANSDTAVGTVTLLLYLIDSELLDYVKPEVNVPNTGKDNIFD